MSWRRRIGLLTLALSVALIAGWVRSLDWHDSMSLNSESVLYSGYSTDGRIEFERFIPGFGQRSPGGTGIHFGGSSLHGEFGRIPFDITADSEMDWRCDWMDFQFATGRYKEVFHHWTFVIPYWSVMLPMTVVSAFLLLAKSRTSTQAKTVHPIPDEGGCATS